MFVLKTNDNINKAKELIKEVYLNSKLPFVIGYSGGKDSTTVTQLFFDVISELDQKQLKNKIYVISSDTLVENPPVIKQIVGNMKNIQREAEKLGLPIETRIVRPLGSQSFWSNIIGRGYPSPNQTFRWCTDRMKIDPANRFIKDKVSEHGEVIMVLGVREGESLSRDRVLKTHSVEGKELMKHSTLNNAFVFAPIRDLTVDDVWDYLLNNTCPWGSNNQDLYKLYANTNSSECPLVIDQETKNSAGSCGNSRLGCWTCTVVNEDKALSGFIEAGDDWLRPLLQYRNWLASIRDDRTLRMKRRTGGSVYFSSLVFKDNCIIIPKKTKRAKVEIRLNTDGKYIDNRGYEWFVFDTEDLAKGYIKKNLIDLSSDDDPRIIAKRKDGTYGILGLGPYNFKARKLILRKLLETQMSLENEFTLITEDELFEIRKIWLKDGDIEDTLPKLYFEITGSHLDWKVDDQPLLDDEALELISDLCEKENIDITIYKKLINEQKKYYGNVVRSKSIKGISSILRMDYLHIGE